MSNLVRLLKILVEHEVKLEPEDVVRVVKKVEGGANGYFPRVEKKRNRALAAMNKSGKKGSGVDIVALLAGQDEENEVEEAEDAAARVETKIEVETETETETEPGIVEIETKTEAKLAETETETTTTTTTKTKTTTTTTPYQSTESTDIMQTLLCSLDFIMNVIKSKQQQQQNTNTNNNFLISGSVQVLEGIHSPGKDSTITQFTSNMVESSLGMPSPSPQQQPPKRESLLQKQATKNGNKMLSRHSSLPNMTSNNAGKGGMLAQKKSKAAMKKKSVHDDSSDEEDDEAKKIIEHEEVVDEINDDNEWQYEPDGDMARNLLISCVLAMDADEDGGCRTVLGWPKSQQIIVDCLGLLRNDKSVVTAACMLIRTTLKDEARKRIVQVARLIEFGLGKIIENLLVIYEEEMDMQVGSVDREINSLLGELGTQFAKIIGRIED